VGISTGSVEKLLSHHIRSVFAMSNNDSMTIDCDTCVMQDTDACSDCVVTYLCDRDVGRTAETAVVISLDDFRAMRALADVGLVPELRHEQR